MGCLPGCCTRTDHPELLATWSHFSHQVYDGTKAWWSEGDTPNPINAYGRSKLEAEQLLQGSWAGRFVALRSSLIYGPESPLAAVNRPLFLQFVKQVLEAGKETTFFTDEYRSALPALLNRLCRAVKPGCC